MTAAFRSHHRTPFTLGREAVRANFWPALLIQAAMLALLLAYYFSLTSREAFDALALFKARHHWPFVVLASIFAGAILPEIFLVAFFQRGRLTKTNFRNLLFTIPIWAIDGSIVDLLYRGEAALLGNVVTVPVVIGKICIDQFGYNPFFADPFGVLTYEWKNSGFSFESLGRALTWTHYREKIIPTLCVTWAVWIPLMAIIYSLPLALQFPLFSLALTFWVLLLTYMTNSFAKMSRAPRDPDLQSAPVAEIVP
ncbi:MAG TPA: hypothetical protein VGG02_11600 [Chthoniobacterales bacterium]|jgi:hypothetical protein